MRKIILMGSAAAIASMFAVSAHAAAPKKNVSTYTVQCETMIASAGIKPALGNTTGGSTVPTAVKIKGTLAGCTVTPDPSDPTPATIAVTGKFGGALTATAAGQNCLSLILPLTVSGDLVVNWKLDKANSDPGVALAQTQSIVHVSQLVGGIFQGPGSPNNLVGQFTLAPSGVDGAFAGTDGGASSNIIGATSQSVVDLATQCASLDLTHVPPLKGPGIKKISLAVGELTLQ